jgi:hypothetical protein
MRPAAALPDSATALRACCSLRARPLRVEETLGEGVRMPRQGKEVEWYRLQVNFPLKLGLIL